MEEKNTLVAFVLIGVVLVLLPYYYNWVGIERENEKEALRDEKIENQLHVDKGSTLDDPLEEHRYPLLGKRNNQLVEREIIVTTPLMQITFSNIGGYIKSCRLLKYEGVHENYVELIPEGGKGSIVRFVGDKRHESLNDQIFVPDAYSVVVQENETVELNMLAEKNGKTVEKSYRFHGNRYGIDLSVNYKGWGEDDNFGLVWLEGIDITEEDPSVDLREGKSVALVGETVYSIEVDIHSEREKYEEKGNVRWAGVRNKYFFIAVVPDNGDQRHNVKMIGEGRENSILPKYEFEVGKRSEGSGKWSGMIYTGPIEFDNLRSYDVGLERVIDFGWPVVRQISKLLLVIFKGMYTYIPNYGVIIVIFAIGIKVLVYPLTRKTYESTAKMQELQPKIQALKEKYGKDQQRLSKETMKLYKEQGVNPLGGCFPMLLQMPVFFALYNLFGRTIELRRAPFIFWIDDLSVPDSLLLGGIDIHVLPLVMAASMLVQQKMTMKDPKQAALVYLMPAVMVFIFWRMSSGLVLYWTVFNILTILQQSFTSTPCRR